MRYGLSCAPVIPQAPDLKEKLSTLSPEARTRLETKIGTCIAKKRADLEAAEAARAEDPGPAVAYFATMMNTCPSPGPEEACYRDHAREINRLHAARRPDAEVPSLFRKSERPGATVTFGLAGALAGTLVAASRQTSVPVGGIVGALAGALAARLV